MRYYFAGAYARRTELAERAAELLRALPGSAVTSSWLVADQAEADNGFSVGSLVGDAVGQAWAYGETDLADLNAATCIVSFTGQGARGGRHVEHGYAIAMRETGVMRLVVVGEREHVFHCHPATEVYADFAAFLNHEVARGEQ